MERTVQKITDWLQAQVKEANAQGLIVGLSGGLDSAVIAHLIKRAFPNNSLAVIMPINSNPDDLAHAVEVLETSQIDHFTIDLTETHKTMLQTIKQEVNTDRKSTRLNSSHVSIS